MDIAYAPCIDLHGIGRGARHWLAALVEHEEATGPFGKCAQVAIAFCVSVCLSICLSVAQFVIRQAIALARDRGPTSLGHMAMARWYNAPLIKHSTTKSNMNLVK